MLRVAWQFVELGSLMLAPLFVSMMYLWMITCAADLGATCPHWCSFVRVNWLPSNCTAACGCCEAPLCLDRPAVVLSATTAALCIFNKLPITGVLQGYQQFTETGIGKLPLLFNHHFLSSSEIIDIKKTLVTLTLKVLMHFYLTKQHCSICRHI